jgi:CheY-like chemotaxis protein
MTQGSKGVVVIAEDAPTLRALYTSAFKAAGYTPMTAPNGLEALNLLTRVQPRVLLLDIAMPELDGVETCRRARGLLGPNVPILFLTSADGMEILRRCLAAGGNDFLVKTDSIDRIIARVDFWAANPARHGALVRQHEVAATIAEPATRGTEVVAGGPSLNDIPDIRRDAKRAEVRQWIATARGVAGVEFGKTKAQQLVLIGYVAAMIDRQAGDDFGLKLTYAQDVMAALKATGGLDDANFLALVDDWVGTLAADAFLRGAAAAQADFELIRNAPADQPVRPLGLGEAILAL